MYHLAEYLATAARDAVLRWARGWKSALVVIRSPSVAIASTYCASARALPGRRSRTKGAAERKCWRSRVELQPEHEGVHQSAGCAVQRQLRCDPRHRGYTALGGSGGAADLADTLSSPETFVETVGPGTV